MLSYCYQGFDLLPKQCSATTARSRRRGPGPRPSVQFKYHLRPSVGPYLVCHSTDGDNLVSVRPGFASAMSKSTTGLGTDMEVMLKDVVTRLAAIEDIVWPL
jgi:hypothetical protein